MTSHRPTSGASTATFPGIETVPGVVEVLVISGAASSPATPPDLLVEVPHGADDRASFERLRDRMRGPLPDHLEEFFFVNTDVGAFAYGATCAARVVAEQPHRKAILVRSEIPRTFIDCNREADFDGGDLRRGGLTAGVAPYVRDAADLELLLGLHARYVEVATAAYAAVCGAGGVALVPHTYAPRSVGIEQVDDRIVDNLRWAYEPGREESWQLRPEVDLMTRDDAGRDLSPPRFEERMLAGFASAGLVAKANETYRITPGSLGHAWAVRYPSQVMCLEVRRDLLVRAWRPLRELEVDAQKVARIADVIAGVLVGER